MGQGGLPLLLWLFLGIGALGKTAGKNGLGAECCWWEGAACRKASEGPVFLGTQQGYASKPVKDQHRGQ